MKNVLQYYYNLNPISIHQINNDYKCRLENSEYIFCKIEFNLNEITSAYELSRQLFNSGIPCNRIVENINKELITHVETGMYILSEMFVDNREITKDDLVQFAKYNVEKNKYNILDRSNWYSLWTAKLDYIEYQVGQLGRQHPLIRNSINYYIGMAETAISLISEIKHNDIYLSVAHRRIAMKNKLRDFYNPLNFVLDSRIRDLSEFYKELFFLKGVNIDELKTMLASYQLTSIEAVKFFARMIYPSYYFDCYQEVILGNIDEKEINKYIVKINDYQKFLKDIYFYLRQYYDMPEIEWIIKT